MNTVTITMALLMGFTGSLHCAGMCGPIVCVMPFQAFGGYKKAIAIGLYHTGRISMYMLLAVALHSFRNLFDPKLQQYVSVTLGVILLVWGVISFLPFRKTGFGLPWVEFIKRQFGKFISKPGLGALFLAGMLNGLLPCGLVYMALAAIMFTGSGIEAAGLIFAFGVGTMPMLLAITILKNRISFLRFNHFKKAVPVIVFAFGCLFVLRGMNLGIPYLSPKVQVENHQIKTSCCHKD